MTESYYAGEDITCGDYLAIRESDGCIARALPGADRMAVAKEDIKQGNKVYVWQGVAANESEFFMAGPSSEAIPAYKGPDGSLYPLRPISDLDKANFLQDLFERFPHMFHADAVKAKINELRNTVKWSQQKDVTDWDISSYGCSTLTEENDHSQ